MDTTGTRLRWDLAAASVTRPYRVTLPMVTLMSLVPCYLVIANLTRQRPAFEPWLPLDRAIPLIPAWALVYGPLYLFLILLPLLVVQQREHIRRTFLAYVTVWLTAYACFIVFPTSAPRPSDVAGEGFAVWGLRFLYEADPPFNCFPSIHVAHSFVSALTCSRIHRGVGRAALACAVLVALSTLFTRQHYVADVAAGALLAVGAHRFFFRGHSVVPSDHERESAPALACVTAAVVAAVGAVAVAAYFMGMEV